MTDSTGQNLTDFAGQVKAWARDLGFAAVGITHAGILEQSARDLHSYLASGFMGDMSWLANTSGIRYNPGALIPEAQSVIMVGLNYYQKTRSPILPPAAGNISLYARGRDYHKILRIRLRRLLQRISQQEPRAQGRIFVDSFPIMEKPLAVRAGLGWIARNTTLIIPGGGSFYFLGGILLNLTLPADPPFTGQHCGNCRRCLDACPTGAIIAPFQLDSRRCISYLTIEHHRPIPEQFQATLGNHIFGCDICQLVCPWNQRFARKSEVKDFHSRWKAADLRLSRLQKMTQPEYESFFAGTPVRRSGYLRFMRNVRIACQNFIRRRQPDRSAQSSHPV